MWVAFRIRDVMGNGTGVRSVSNFPNVACEHRRLSRRPSHRFAFIFKFALKKVASNMKLGLGFLALTAAQQGLRYEINGINDIHSPKGAFKSALKRSVVT